MNVFYAVTVCGNTVKPCCIYLNDNYKKCAMEEKVIQNIRSDENEFLRLNIWDTGYSQDLLSVDLLSVRNCGTLHCISTMC